LLKQELTQFNQTAEEKTRLLQDNASLTETNRDLQAKFLEKDRLYNVLSSFEVALRKKETLTMELTGKKQLYADQGSRAERLRKEVEGVEQELSKFADYEKTEPLLQKMQTQLETAKTLSHEVAATERSWQTLQNEVAEAEQKLPSVDQVKIGRETVSLQKPILPFGLASVVIFAGAVLALVAGNLLAFVFLALAGLVPLAIVLMRVGAATSAARHQSILGDLRYLEDKRQELARTGERRKQIAEECESGIAELTNLCENLPAYGDVFRSHRSHGIIEAAQFALQTAQGDKQSREALRVKLQTVRNEMNRLPSETVLTGLANEISDLERRLNELVFPSLPDGIVFTPEFSSATVAERDQLGRLMTATQTKIDQNLQRIIGLDKYLTEHRDIMSKVQLQEDVVKKLEHQLSIVRKALDGIQATAESLRNRVRPSVQGYMGSILPALTSSRYRAAILDDDYNLQVWDPEAGEYKPKEVFSGGTEDQFLLAMRLAFALALLPEVKGQKPEFVFLDEPLGSSDDIRRSGIVEYLALDLSKKFKQIFIISHVGGLEDHVQNVITMDEGRVARAESA
jgi:exonuclease SbcC